MFHNTNCCTLRPARSTTMRKILVLFASCLAVFLSVVAGSTTAWADDLNWDTDRDEVRSRISRGGWNVVWGVNWGPEEKGKLFVSTVAGNPGAYFSDYLDRTIEKMSENSEKVGKAALRDAMLRALRGGQVTRTGDLAVKGGIAEYYRWKTTSLHVPTGGTERYWIDGPWGTGGWGFRPEMKLVKRKVGGKILGDQQPYVAFRVYRPSNSSSTSGTSQGSSGGGPLVRRIEDARKKMMARLEVSVVLRIGKGVNRSVYSIDDGSQTCLHKGKLRRFSKRGQAKVSIKWDADIRTGRVRWETRSLDSGTYVFERRGDTIMLSKQSSSVARP